MFIDIPENFGSLWGDLVYEFVTFQNQDLVFEVWDDNTDRLIGVKKFYSTKSAKFNIASLLRYESLPNMAVCKSGFYLPNDGFVAVKVKCGEVETPLRIFTLRREAAKKATLMSSMPKKRYVEYGDSDILRLALNESFAPSATALVTYRGGREESRLFSAEEEGFMHCFVVDTSVLDEDPTALKLEIELEDEPNLSLDYNIVPRRDKSVRLAWVSSAGGVEHYTFTLVNKKIIRGDGAMELTLRSAYGTAAELEALSEIMTSIKVWRASPKGYELVDVVSDEFPIRRDGVLQVAEFKIRDKSGSNIN